ncbi:hypothetical protein [uncultured Hymenobacter sp.]|uniref:hypothetical protein n=1 Tax=uncultured Hymenobacter sp. TaxID=170016 RepID=UPI0035C94661
MNNALKIIADSNYLDGVEITFPADNEAATSLLLGGTRPDEQKILGRIWTKRLG